VLSKVNALIPNNLICTLTNGKHSMHIRKVAYLIKLSKQINVNYGNNIVTMTTRNLAPSRIAEICRTTRKSNIMGLRSACSACSITYPKTLWILSKLRRN